MTTLVNRVWNDRNIDNALSGLGLMRRDTAPGVGTFFIGLGVGLVGGAAIALLLTPYSGGEARVQVRLRAAEFGRDHDFADQLDDHLAFLLRVDFAPGLFPLCTHGRKSFSG